MPADYGLYLKTLIPNLLHLKKYVRGASQYANKAAERKRLYARFLEECDGAGKRCMQIGARGSRLGKNWVSVDRYDNSPIIDFHYDVRELDFGDAAFDAVVCNAVLEHVEEPVKAVSELRRVLKTDGKIWVEVPFNQPYHPTPGDFWRVTPDGLRIWMRSFAEISSGAFYGKGSLIYTGTYFYGSKP